jgi:hypothetical protein
MAVCPFNAERRALDVKTHWLNTLSVGAGLSPWIVANPPNDTLPTYRRLLDRLFLRMSVCPSDYNRDGTSSSGNPGPDWTPFIDHYTNAPGTTPAQHLYADWNFDGIQSLIPPPTIFNNGDWAKFNAGFGSQPGGCPNN